MTSGERWMLEVEAGVPSSGLGLTWGHLIKAPDSG